MANCGRPTRGAQLFRDGSPPDLAPLTAAQEHFWRVTPVSVELLTCRVQGACPGGDHRRQNVTVWADRHCAAGFRGPLCGYCEAGFRKMAPSYRTGGSGWESGRRVELSSRAHLGRMPRALAHPSLERCVAPCRFQASGQCVECVDPAGSWGVFVAVLVIIILVLVLLCMWRRKKKAREQEEARRQEAQKRGRRSAAAKQVGPQVLEKRFARTVGVFGILMASFKKGALIELDESVDTRSNGHQV